MVALAVGTAFEFQSHGGVINPYVRLEDTARVFREVHRLVPHPAPDSVIFFEIPHDQRSPFGWDRNVNQLSCVIFGVPAFQGREISPQMYLRRVFGYPGTIEGGPRLCKRFYRFRVDQYGGVSYVGERKTQPQKGGEYCEPCLHEKLDYDPREGLPFLAGREGRHP